MFQYDVISYEEALAERFQLMKEGIYDAVVTSSQDKRSLNSGNPMMDMTLTVYDDNGRSHEIRDFLVFTKPMMWKILHFSDSAGLLNEYHDGKLCSEVIINKRVVVKVAIEKGREIPNDKLNGKPAGTCYFDKNKVGDYIKKVDQIKKTDNDREIPPHHEDIPF